ncbi:MAG TPA: GNAT family N-acetyltransferase [Vicinamibacterales bacterium]|nr:GNAT family N-acetyltransferase [Vicinamibacterales bacterium]
MELTTLDRSRHADAVAVLCDAFFDYPVMRFIIGPAAQYERRLNSLVGYFTAARFLNGDLVVGVADSNGALIGVANVTRAGERPPSPELASLRETLWRELGSDARERYESLVRIWQTFAVEQPNVHLNMLGVRRAWQKRGVARLLLDAVHDFSARTTESCGVTLSTEDPANVPFYQRFGYRIVGEAPLPGAFTTWGFFRPNPPR